MNDATEMDWEQAGSDDTADDSLKELPRSQQHVQSLKTSDQAASDQAWVQDPGRQNHDICKGNDDMITAMSTPFFSPSSHETLPRAQAVIQVRQPPRSISQSETLHHGSPISSVSYPRSGLLTQQRTWTNSVRGMTPPPGQPSLLSVSIAPDNAARSHQHEQELHRGWPPFAYSLLAEEHKVAASCMENEPVPGPESMPSGSESKKRAMTFEDDQVERHIDVFTRPKAQIKRARSDYVNMSTPTPSAAPESSATPMDMYSLFWADDQKPYTALQVPDVSVRPDEYSPAPLEYDDSFRLLCIEPGDRDLKCRIHSTRLSNLEHPYEALSYVWGNLKTSSQAIEVYHDSISGYIRITDNLHLALLHLRSQDKPRYLWVDATCINQQNAIERGHQVALMGQIYSRASKVVVWLGPDPNNKARIAFSVISNIASGADINGRAVEQANFFSNGVSSANIPDLPCRDELPKASFKALWSTVQDIFSNDWFWRLWCIQEVVLAREAQIHWGTCHIAWSTLGLAATRLRTSVLPILELHPMPGVFNAYFMYSMSTSRTLIASEGLHPIRLPFLKLLLLTTHFDVSNAHDRIYGLLGMPTSEMQLHGRHLKLNVTPDYTRSLLETYTDIISKALDQDEANGDSQNLALVLSAVQHTTSETLTQSQCWPSWMPQWGTGIAQSLLTSSFVPLVGAKNRAVISALPQPRLYINAIFCDHVDSVMPMLPLNLNALELFMHSKDQRKSLAMTLTGGKSWCDGSADTDEHLMDFEGYLKHWQDSSNVPRESGAQRFAQAIQNVAMNRVLFSMLQSGQIGLGPLQAQPGDIVAILEGAGTAFILRPCVAEQTSFEGEYKLVGECYVYKLVDTASAAGRVLQRIALI